MDHNNSYKEYEEMIELTKTFKLKLGVFNLQQKITLHCCDDHFESLTKLLKDLQGDINGLLLALTENKLHNKDGVVKRRNPNQHSPKEIQNTERSSTMSNQSTDSGRSTSDLRDSGRSSSGLRDSGRSSSGLRDSGRSSSGLRDSGRSSSGLRDSGRSSSGFRDSGTLSMPDASIQHLESYAVSNQAVNILESSLTTLQLSQQPSSEKEDSNMSFLFENENLERLENNNNKLPGKDNKESNVIKSEECRQSDWKARNIEPSEHEDPTICRESKKARHKLKKSSISDSTLELTVCLICNKSNSPGESDYDSDTTMVSIGIQTENHIEQCQNDKESGHPLHYESATSEENFALQTPSSKQYQIIHNITDNVVSQEHQGQEREMENTFENQNGMSELTNIASEAENETTI